MAEAWLRRASGRATSRKSTLRLMPAIVRSAALAIVVVACLLADTHADIIDVFTAMAAALSDTNVPEFMGAFDKDMPGYGKLKTDVTALMTQADISSSVEPIKDEGDDAARKMDLDWFLQVRSLIPD